MKKIVDFSIASSLKEFLQYKMWTDLEACRMETGSFYQYEDERLPNYFVYGSPYAPWTYDSSLSGQGISIPTGFAGYERNQINIDFKNGRLISTGELPNLTGVYEFPVSEISFYVSSQPDWVLRDELNYLSLPDLEPADSYVPPNSYVAPVVFVKSQNTTNEILALGGCEWSVWNFRISCIVRDEFELTAIQKVVRDCARAVFPILPETPLNPYNDLKFGYWNYEDYSVGPLSYYAFIEDTSFRIIEPDIWTNNHPNTFMGVGSIEVRVPRQPRASGTDPNFDLSYALSDVSSIFDTDDESNFVLS